MWHLTKTQQTVFAPARKEDLLGIDVRSEDVKQLSAAKRESDASHSKCPIWFVASVQAGSNQLVRLFFSGLD